LRPSSNNSNNTWNILHAHKSFHAPRSCRLLPLPHHRTPIRLALLLCRHRPTQRASGIFTGHLKARLHFPCRRRLAPPVRRNSARRKDTVDGRSASSQMSLPSATCFVQSGRAWPTTS
jgi:hypothetical protein